MTSLGFRSLLLGVAALACASASSAMADKIKHPTAVFAGLDKITGRIISFEVAVDETVQFGSLQVTAKACFTRPATEAPQTTTFVEVDEISTSNDYKRIFGGWMYAASPGLHGIEHSVYDIWLTDCKGGTEVIKTGPEVADLPPPVPALEEVKTPKPGTVPLPKPKKPPPVAEAPTLPPPVVVERKTPTQRFFPTDIPPENNVSDPGRRR